jgi:hypothetical protein
MQSMDDVQDEKTLWQNSLSRVNERRQHVKSSRCKIGLCNQQKTNNQP